MTSHSFESASLAVAVGLITALQALWAVETIRGLVITAVGYIVLAIAKRVRREIMYRGTKGLPRERGDNDGDGYADEGKDNGNPKA